VLAEKEARDQEPADDEEDVDADEAAGDREAGVKEEHEEDGDPAEALDIRAEGIGGGDLGLSLVNGVSVHGTPGARLRP
jgi:hypothetical protein